MPDDDVLLALTRTISDRRPVEFDRLAETDGGQNFAIVVQLRAIGAVARAHVDAARDFALPCRWRNLELRQVLGQGAFGRVYRAWDGNLEREVALKLTEAADSRDLAEARLLARVRHPNVVQVHGVERHEGYIGLWMELIHGQTLEALIRDRGPMSAHEAALIGVELCRAVAAVHAARLVHGDIKAQNVMREGGGRIVLMDFGIGHAVTGEASSGEAIAGTPAYMAPELLSGLLANVATDIYAIGVLLYHLVSGAYPVSGRSIGEIRAAHEQGRTVLLRDRRPDLPQEFVSIVGRALSPRAEDRFASAGAFERALLQSITSIAPPVAKPKRRRIVWLAIAAAIVALLAAAVWLLRPVPPPRSRAIAVLPFSNVGADSATEYFADGITEELINALGRMKGLRVVARNTAFRFKGKTDRIQDVGTALKVGTVVCGTVRRSGDRLRITAEMFNVADGYRLWAETYDRQLKDVFAIQEDIARSVSTGLRVQLAASGLAERQPSFPAYDSYLMGRFHYNKRSVGSMRRGLGYFEKAVAEDPSFALAYAGIADSYSSLVDYGGLPAPEGMPRAKAAALRALSLNGGLAEAHASLGLACSLYDWKWQACEQSLKRAIELDSNLVTAHHWYGTLLMKTGRLDEAMAEGRQALTLDPLNLPVNAFIAFLFAFSHQYEQAIEQARKVLELDPSNVHAHHALAQLYAWLGRRSEALQECEKSAALAGDSPLDMRYRATAMAVLGMMPEARQILQEMEEKRRREGFQIYYLAVLHAALGEKSRALDLLERAFQEHDTSLPYVTLERSFDSLRAEPRYARLISNLGVARR